MTEYAKSCFYYPTTILMVDDNQSFLESLVLQLKGEILTAWSSNVRSALQKISTNHIPSSIKKVFCVDNDYDTDGEENIHFDISIKNIINEIHNPNRFSHISTLLVDYSMPELNGIELCSEIQSESMVKIMLTGEADYRTAISAFNNGQIDKFFRKNDKDMLKVLVRALLESQNTYFENLSKPLIDALATDKQHVLQEDFFWEIFNKICTENKIVEYYLIDKNGSFLLLNQHAKPFLFIIRTEQEFKNLLDIAIDNGASKTVILDIKTHKKMPIFFSEEDHKLSVKHWNILMHNFEKINQNKDYYFTIIEDKVFSNINYSNVISYIKYMKDNDQQYNL